MAEKRAKPKPKPGDERFADSGLEFITVLKTKKPKPRDPAVIARISKPKE